MKNINIAINANALTPGGAWDNFDDRTLGDLVNSK
jgi:hypothetical protein